MIGGSGNCRAKIARTKSSPDIDAITSMGTTPYSMDCLLDLSLTIARLHILMRGPDPGILRKDGWRVKIDDEDAMRERP
jgi:hypothetical protein